MRIIKIKPRLVSKFRFFFFFFLCLFYLFIYFFFLFFFFFLEKSIYLLCPKPSMKFFIDVLKNARLLDILTDKRIVFRSWAADTEKKSFRTQTFANLVCHHESIPI